jgi:hypothetical protein
MYFEMKVNYQELMKEFQDKRSLNSSSDTLFDKNVSVLPTKALEPLKEEYSREKRDGGILEVFAIPQQGSLKVYRAATAIQPISTEIRVESKHKSVQSYQTKSSLDTLPLKGRINVDVKEHTIAGVEQTIDFQRDEYNRKTNRILFSNIVGLERDAAMKETMEKIAISSSCDKPSIKLEDSEPDNDNILVEMMETPVEIAFVVESCEKHNQESTILESSTSQYIQDVKPVQDILVKKTPPLKVIPAKAISPATILPPPVANAVKQVFQQADNSPQAEKRTDESIQRILGFLRTVEQQDVDTYETSPTRTKSFSTSVNTSSSLEGVKQKIMKQQLEIDEKSRSLELFKNEIRKVKEEMRDQEQQL